MSGAVSIRAMTEADGAAVLAIYEEGIATGHATFETGVPDWPAFSAARRPDCRLVAIDGGGVIGWAMVSPTSSRPVYRGVGEVGIYIAAAARGRGVGDALLGGLVLESEAAGIWTLQAGVFPENAASLALHTRHGFRELGRRERIGLMAHGPLAGRWRDVILLERRSWVVGE